eukprot:TRINITY_DN10437_c0_g1_i1.p1 TRINITY_DN10437_c0_g1~~TRINITY_DN10437_c0_g1_i1.p1  ORF type:complete len:267 (+),score=22.81 TRINITY_DN10437_c0_g1_i1:33-833(+)
MSDTVQANILFALVSKLLSAPIDRVKLTLQCQNELLRQGSISRRYNGIIECFWSLVNSSGFWSMFAGSSWSIARYITIRFLNWMDFGGLFGLIHSSNILKTITFSAIIYPFDVAHSLVACQPHKYSASVFSEVLNVRGFFGLYHGYFLYITGLLSYQGIFNLLLHWFPIKDQESVLTRLIRSIALPSIAGTLTYPIDTVRRRMLLRLGKQNSDMLSCTNDIVKHENVSAFFDGAGTNILKSIIGFSVIIVLDDVVSFMFGNSDVNE